MSRQYFGTDGIRGTVGQAPITPDFVLRLAHAVGRVLKRTESRPTVIIGKDTRISGYMLESALESGFNSAGVDVVLLGPLPTPGVAYLTRAQRATMLFPTMASNFSARRVPSCQTPGSWPLRTRWPKRPSGPTQSIWARRGGWMMLRAATSNFAKAPSPMT